MTDLIGHELDAAVARADGETSEHTIRWALAHGYSPSTDWTQGGPLIERNMIDLEHANNHGEIDFGDGCGEMTWRALAPSARDSTGLAEGLGPTPLIAAMRAFVASKR